MTTSPLKADSLVAFEKWASEKHGFHGVDFEWHQTRNCYANFGIHFAYMAWVESRAAIVVELPEPAQWDICEVLLDKGKTVQSIRAAGITVKGDS